ncbi:FAD-binding protein [Brevibacillus choshinensis]|uniref:FAD-binding oxidoreductase n=1 Tax=Brevibacillus choshinensis TaxID=54911 RepID=A0ABX7FVJ6_BRECH|nr:FAD-binding oxidoreductase [Brevibacillus choshinensis]QRG70278.1 FAD-binding oxidoreductase [Brevibacillus choshinensis]
MVKSKENVLSGWGNFPKQTGHVYRPEKYKDLQDILRLRSQSNFISRGAGRSYGDNALNDQNGVILHTRLNRFLSFDEQTQVLECEAGVTFGEIIEYFLPHGYLPPVTPGTKYVTVGGAISNEVHGKNHHQDGSFSNHILDFQLLVASGEFLTCSRSENQELFWATVGGIGLTGIILSARIKLMRVESAYLEVDYKKTSNLDETIVLLNEMNGKYQYSVAWIDCLSTDRTIGRSILMLGNHALQKQLDGKVEPLSPRRKRNMIVPFYFPSFGLNSSSIKTFNSFYYHRFKDASRQVVDYDSFFYPLDTLLHWNRLYGKAGFIQYQAVFPPETARMGLTELLQKVSQGRCASFLAVLKILGERSGGLLAFPRKGYTLALDIPLRGGTELLAFIRKLDEVVLAHRGVLYLAKDALMSADMFAQMYPELPKFKEVKAKIDPGCLFSSSMARRLNIVGNLG